MAERVYCSRQAVHQRLVKHVVRHLSGRIARAACVVHQDDIELPKTGLMVGVHWTRSPATILLTIEGKIVLEHKHGELRRREWIGLHIDSDGREGSCTRCRGRHRSAGSDDRSATHTVAALSCIEASGHIRYTISAVGTPVCGGKRVSRISRQDGQVVTLGRIEINLAGSHYRLRCQPWTCPANAVADIANRLIVGASGWIEDRLARFAGHSGACRPDATCRDERHVASVEIRPKGQRYSACRGVRCAVGSSGRPAHCRGFCGVDIESAVFLNDPPIVRYNGCIVSAVQNRHAKIGRCWEGQRHGRGGSGTDHAL